MRDPETCRVEYCGYNKPQNQDELEFEILGLETALCEIKKRIATLKQSEFLVKVTLKEQDVNYFR